MFRFRSSRTKNASIIRAFVFGVEDSVVSTVGLLSGVAVGEMPRQSIILAGIVLIFVEAFSMGAGEFLSNASADDYKEGTHPLRLRSVVQGIVMFISYLVFGFFVLSPYLAFPVTVAFWVSIVLATLILLGLGVGNAYASGVSMFVSAVRMVVIGGFALCIGILAATVTKGLV